MLAQLVLSHVLAQDFMQGSIAIQGWQLDPSEVVEDDLNIK